jgi:hypothetical protein
VVSRLHRSLIRDLWHLRGQVLAAGLVVACGLAAFVTMRSAYHSLLSARAEYYAEFRFADVFGHLKRAPEPLTATLSAIPGVTAIEARIVQDVTLSVPNLAEPATGRLISIPDVRRPMLNDLFIRVGRYPATGRTDEVIASETFADANGLKLGERIGAILNGLWTQLTITGLALSPEYIYEVSPAMIFPDNRRFGVMWMSRDALEGAFDMIGAFNDVALQLAPETSEGDVIAAVDRALAPFGGTSAYGRSDQASNMFLSDELGEIEVTATYIRRFSECVRFCSTLLSRLISTERGQILLKAFGYSMRGLGCLPRLRAHGRCVGPDSRRRARGLLWVRHRQHVSAVLSLPRVAVQGAPHRCGGDACDRDCRGHSGVARGGVARRPVAARRSDAPGAAEKFSRGGPGGERGRALAGCFRSGHRPQYRASALASRALDFRNRRGSGDGSPRAVRVRRRESSRRRPLRFDPAGRRHRDSERSQAARAPCTSSVVCPASCVRSRFGSCRSGFDSAIGRSGRHS